MLRTITRGDTSQQIDLGDQDMLAVTLTSSNNGLLTQSYGNLLRQQQSVAGTGIDSGLAVKIAAYQGQMNHQAQYFQQSNLSGLINQITHASNFAALLGAFASGLPQTDSALLDNAKLYAQQLSELANQAEDYQVGAQIIATQYQVAADSLQPLLKSYDQAIDQLINNLSSEAQQLSKDITALNQAIAANIQGIVDQGEKAGAGVRQLGLAILTTLTLQNDKKLDDKPDAKPVPAADKGAGEQVEYMIAGINALSSGIAGSSQAAKDLRSNNDKLAQAYMALAKTNSMITVAKSAQAQSQLFAESFYNTQKSVVRLPGCWLQIVAAYRKAALIWQNLSAVDNLQQLRRNVQLCNQEWQLLAEQVAYIKASFAGNGSLPLA